MIDNFLHRACAWTLALCLALAPALANQSNLWSPTTGTVSGLQLTTNYNNALSAIASCNSGATAPTNDQSAASVYGQCWLNTSVTPNAVETYDGTSWVVVGWIDTTNHYWISNAAGGTGTIASATSTDLGTVKNQVVAITGTTTITSFGSTALPGARYFLNFTGILTLTHNGTSLILPNGGSNIATAAGDTAIAEYLGSGNWRVVSYQRANGSALSSASVFTSGVFFDGVITPSALASNTSNWNPAGLSAANVIRLSCSAVVNISGIVAPATDGQVLVLNNVGATNNCILTVQDPASSAANRFAFDRPIALRPGRTVTIKYDATTARWVPWTEIPSQLVAGGFKNLRILNVANAFGDSAPATPNNQNKIVLEEISLEDSNGGAMRIAGAVTVVDATGTNTPSTFTCTIDITTSGAGGLDTGSVAASTWYYHWIGFNPTANTATCWDSVSATSPSPPAGYTFQVRAGANQTDASSHFYRVQQHNRSAHYVFVASTNTLGPRVMQGGTFGSGSSTSSPTYAALIVAGNGRFVPSTASRIAVSINIAFGGNQCGYVFVANSAAYGGTNNGPSGTNGLMPPMVGGQLAGGNGPAPIDLESNSIYVWSNYTTSPFTPNGCAEYAVGWEDNL